MYIRAREREKACNYAIGGIEMVMKGFLIVALTSVLVLTGIQLEDRKTGFRESRAMGLVGGNAANNCRKCTKAGKGGYNIEDCGAYPGCACPADGTAVDPDIDSGYCTVMGDALDDCHTTTITFSKKKYDGECPDAGEGCASLQCGTKDAMGDHSYTKCGHTRDKES